MDSGIYKITNIIDGKFYIGSSKHLDRRWWEHQDNLRKKEHCNPVLQHAWDYYGEHNFKFETLEEIDESLLIEREQYYLDTLKPFRNVGYNIAQ